jgi:hypothetical protein
MIEENWGKGQGEGLQRCITLQSWIADFYEGPSLLELLDAFLTDADRAHLAWKVRAAAAPFPLRVAAPAGTCDGCGGDCGPTAKVVGEVEGRSQAPGQAEGGGPWCFACIRRIYEAMREAQG